MRKYIDAYRFGSQLWLLPSENQTPGNHWEKWRFTAGNFIEDGGIFQHVWLRVGYQLGMIWSQILVPPLDTSHYTHTCILYIHIMYTVHIYIYILISLSIYKYICIHTYIYIYIYAHIHLKKPTPRPLCSARILSQRHLCPTRVPRQGTVRFCVRWSISYIITRQLYITL